MSSYKENDETNKLLAGCFVALLGIGGFIVLLVYGTWVSALIVSSFWQWFIAPVFVGVPEQLTMLQAAGLGLIVGYMTKTSYVPPSDDKEKTSAKAARVLLLLASPWITLLMGYVIHSMM